MAETATAAMAATEVMGGAMLADLVEVVGLVAEAARSVDTADSETTAVATEEDVAAAAAAKVVAAAKVACTPVRTTPTRWLRC